VMGFNEIDKFLLGACESGNSIVVKACISDGANINAITKAGDPLIVRAIVHINVDSLKLLVANGLEVNAKNTKGETAMIIAAWEARVEVMACLLDSGAHINMQDNNGWSALHEAIRGDDGASVALLLKRGADVTANTGEDVFPLVISASRNEAKKHEVMRLLVDAGANIDCLIKDYPTDYHFCRMLREPVELRLAVGREARPQEDAPGL